MGQENLEQPYLQDYFWQIPKVEQQQYVLVLDQEKLPIDLNLQHSTDTSAIKSFEQSANIATSAFDYATGIAVFVALCATGLAYWFGVRSFILTKQGFELTLEQIGKSVEQTLNSNKELYRSQKDLQLMQIRATHRQDWINNVRDLFTEILVVRSNIKTILINLKPDGRHKKELYENLKKLESLKYEMDLFLNPEEEVNKEIIKEIFTLIALCQHVYNDNENVINDIDLYLSKKDKTAIKNNMQALLKNEWNRVKKGE